MWRSPELLGQEKKKTKQGDVYSFGIIMSEIITRLEPFESYGYKPKGKFGRLLLLLLYKLKESDLYRVFKKCTLF